MPTRTRLETSLPRNPTVRLADKVNSTFVGKYLAVRTTQMDGKDSNVYEFAAVSGDAPVTRKNPQGEYVEVVINAGDTVTIFGSKAIDQALGAAKVGQIIEFKFLGQKKGKNGRKFNNFDIFVVEP